MLIEEPRAESRLGNMQSEARIKGANGIRAVACLFVIFHHLAQRLNPDAPGLPLWVQKVHYCAMRGEVGVSIFFVLSGCLLSMPFWRSLIQGGAAPSLRSYVRNRASRILPGYYLLLCISALVGQWLLHQGIGWSRLAASFLFLNNFDYHTFFPSEVDTPLWSIGLEIWCYVLLPFVMLGILRCLHTVKGAALALLGVIVGLQLLNPIVISMLMTDGKDKGWQYGLIGGAKVWFPYWNLDSFLTQFLIGSCASLFICWRYSKAGLPSVLGDVVGCVALLTALGLVLIRLNPGAPDDITHQPYLTPLFPALIALALAGISQGKILWRLLDNAFFRYIASISFGLYVWHWLLISIVELQWMPNFVYFGMNSLSRWTTISASILFVSILIASLSWFVLERPILQKYRKADYVATK